METNNNFTMNFNAPVGEVKTLQTKTEMIVARLNAEYEAERAVIRKKMNEERDCIDAVERIRNQHKENIRKLQNEEDALRVKWMEEKARILEEAEYNRGNE
jgi:peptidoglycan hydrolase CwlO-like protein